MQASLSSTRSFFRRPGRFKGLHRKQKSADSTASRDSTAPSEPQSRAYSPLDVASEAQLQTEADAAPVAQQWTEPTPPPSGKVADAETRSAQGSDEESTPRKSEETMKLSFKPEHVFQGLPEYPGDQSNQGLIDDKYLKAFGIKLEGNMGTDGTEKVSQGIGIVMTPPPEKDRILFEMEVPEQGTREARPELQVSIPRNKISTRSSSIADNGNKSQTPHSIISPPMTSRPGPNANTNPLGITGSQTSIVSPLSAVEAPKTKRPLSTLSISQTAGNAKKPGSVPAMKSANSMSSNDTSEQDGRSSGFSERSSMSSVNSDITARKEQPLRRPMIVDATAMRVDSARFQATSTPIAPNVSRSRLSTRDLGKEMRRQNSATSIRSTSTVNVNKPLPPEPLGTLNSNGSTRMSHVTGHPQTPSRSSSVTVRQGSISAKSIHDTLSSASVKTVNVARRGSKGSTSKSSLRSKYSPKEPESPDYSTPKKACPSPKSLYSNRTSPSQSQTSLLPDQKLHTIREDSPRDSRATAPSREPKQISRGPMRMEPSRRAPQPPAQTPHRCNTTSAEKPEKPRFMKRSHSSNHIGAAAKGEVPGGLHRRMTSQATGSISKANRILGKSGSSTPVRRDFPRVFEPSRMVAQSPVAYSRASTPSTNDGRNTPELEACEDAHFEEIRKRLELLSPKDDPSVTFLAFHEKNAPPPSERCDPMEQTEVVDSKSFSRKSSQPPSPKYDAGPKYLEPIAELQAHRTPSPRRAPSPIELEGSTITRPVELGLPSPVQVAISSPTSTSIPVPPIPIPPVPTDASLRRGRLNYSNPQSTISGSGKARSLHSQRSTKARSLASLAASDIPDIYAGLPTPPNLSLRPSMTAEEVEQLITADAAERVLLHILESLDNLEDLFAAALVSRGFYRTFKRNELHLLKRAIFRMSPAAWELREMSIPYSELEAGANDYTPNLYFRHYVQDLLTMVELKALILESCKSFLRQDTILAMAGEAEDRSPAIDEAFWRVWIFCRIFGCGNHREDDVVGQMDWLKGGVIAKQSSDTRTLALTDELARNSVLYNPPKGFAWGNGKGLTAEELYDMMEIWTCLGVLVRVYQGKREEAREYGVFDNANVAPGDAKMENAILEEWTHYLMTLAPSTILDVTSPNALITAMLAHARSQGYTSWKPPAQDSSRSTFLKEAVSRVYEEKHALVRTTSASPKSFSDLPQVATPKNCESPPSPGTALASRQRVAQHAAELRAKKQDPTYRDVPVSTERPMSNYKDVLNRLEALSTSAEPGIPPVPKLPGLAVRLSRRMPKVSISSPTRAKASPASASSSVVSLPTPATAEQSAKSGAPASASGAASPTLRTAAGGRISSLRDRVASRAETPTRPDPRDKGSRSGTPVEVTDEKVPVPPAEDGGAAQEGNGPPRAPTAVPKGPQVRDPVDLAVERLVAMGFDEMRAKRALAETDSGNRINFEKALTRLIKEKEKLERLERLRKMG